jgi:hypothetical protein
MVGPLCRLFEGWSISSMLPKKLLPPVSLLSRLRVDRNVLALDIWTHKDGVDGSEAVIMAMVGS